MSRVLGRRCGAGPEGLDFTHPSSCWEKRMRKILIIALTAAAGLSIAACSEKTQDAAETTADAAASDVAGAADAAGDAAEAAATDAGRAVDKAAAATDEMGDKVEQKAAEVEADAHNESVSEAKAD